MVPRKNIDTVNTGFLQRIFIRIISNQKIQYTINTRTVPTQDWGVGVGIGVGFGLQKRLRSRKPGSS